MFWGIVAAYLVLSIATARTLMPWCDEAWFSGPALELLRWGSMGTPVLDPTADWHGRVLTGIGHYTYWITPLYPVSQFLWFHVAPFGLYSVLWGLAALTACWALVRKLTGEEGAALLTMALIAVDAAFVRGAGAGRMDIMCVALGTGALALYVMLRERHLTAAVGLSHAAIAAAALVHPLALAWCAALAVVTLDFDARRLRWRQVACVLAPYLAAAAGWGAYIARNPALWWMQFGGNASHRLPEGSAGLWIYKQTVVRFLYYYGFSPASHGAARAHMLVLALYALGAAGALEIPAIRRQKGCRTLVLIWLTVAAVALVVDQDIQDYYMPHFAMPLAALLAVGMWTNWRERIVPRWALAGMAAALVLVQMATTARHIRENEYRRDYLAAADYLKQNQPPGEMVFGSAELAF